jgi:hypothetical protein
LLLAIAITAACASGTGDSPSPSTSQGTDQLFPNWPPLLNDFRFHWTAEPVIDLTMGPAVAVRAYLESYDAATFTLDPNNVYPGFLRATPANQEREGDYLTQLTRIRPLVGYTKGPKDAWTHYGFVTYHVLHLNPKGNAFEAIVCGGEYSHFVNSLAQPGKLSRSRLTRRPGSRTRAARVYPCTVLSSRRAILVSERTPRHRSPRRSEVRHRHLIRMYSAIGSSLLQVRITGVPSTIRSRETSRRPTWSVSAPSACRRTKPSERR